MAKEKEEYKIMPRTQQENYDDYADRFMESKFANGIDSWRQLRQAMEHFQGTGLTSQQELKLMPVVAQKVNINEPRRRVSSQESTMSFGLYGTIKGVFVRIRLTTDKKGRIQARDRSGRFAKRNKR